MGPIGRERGDLASQVISVETGQTGGWRKNTGHRPAASGGRGGVLSRLQPDLAKFLVLNTSNTLNYEIWSDDELGS